jgi:hypothetical protein
MRKSISDNFGKASAALGVENYQELGRATHTLSRDWQPGPRRFIWGPGITLRFLARKACNSSRGRLIAIGRGIKVL